MLKILSTVMLSLLLVACGGGEAGSEQTNIDSRSNPSLNLNVSEIATHIDEFSFQIEASTNSDSVITYKSLDESVAKVNDLGLVTFMGIGSTKIVVELESTEDHLALTQELAVTISGNSPRLSTESLEINKVYGDIPFELVTSSLSPALKTYSSSNVQVASINHEGLVSIVGAGQATLQIEQSTVGSYSGDVITISLNVAKIVTAITPQQLVINKSISNQPFSIDYVSNNPSQPIFLSDNTEAVTVDEFGIATLNTLGTATITIQQAETNNYLEGISQVTVNVSKENTELTKTSILSGVKFENSLVLSGVIESNSSAALSFTSLTPSLLEIDGDNFKILGAGSISFRVESPETVNFMSATQEFTFNVAKGDGFLSIEDLKPMMVGEQQTVSANTHDNVGVNILVTTTDLLSVSEVGTITATGSGNARIVIETKASANFNTVQEEVPLLVIPSDLIGVDLYSTSSKLRINDLTTGLELLYSSSDSCDPLSIESCADYQVIALDITPVSISTMSQNTKGYVWLRTETGDLSARSVVDSEADYGHFSARYGHQVVSFNNAYWLIGGSDDNSGVYSSEIWKSNDGYFWDLVTDSAPFGGRAFHQVVEFNSELYLIGGDAGSSGRLGDVWKSSNGQDWTLVTSDGGYGARYYHQVAVHGGELILVGGRNTSNQSTRDVWSSSDGETWQLLNNAGSFNSLYGHQMVSFGSYLWLIGGYGGSYTHEIWKSYDGTSWASVTNPSYPDFPSLALFQVVATDSNIWVFPDQYVSEVWTCCSWSRVSTTVAFPLRSDYQAVENLDSGFLFIGGGSYSKRYQDVWSRYSQLKPIRFSFL